MMLHVISGIVLPESNIYVSVADCDDFADEISDDVWSKLHTNMIFPIECIDSKEINLSAFS